MKEQLPPALQFLLKFRVEGLEWIGLVEKTGVEQPEYRVTEFGKAFICAHPHPRDLREALERLRRVREAEDIKEWLAIRKEAVLKIEPETAEVNWCYENIFDPYGVGPDLPEEYKQFGTVYFARSPGSDVWVWFDDLPEKVREALWKRHKSKQTLPASLH